MTGFNVKKKHNGNFHKFFKSSLQDSKNTAPLTSIGSAKTPSLRTMNSSNVEKNNIQEFSRIIEQTENTDVTEFSESE
jgi:hypothetical protein